MLLATQIAAEKIAKERKLEVAAVLAVIEVESAGQITAKVNGRPEPLIRWEGHYFYRRLTGADRDRAVAAGLASPRAGGVANPRNQADRWALLDRAVEIDADAAFESISIGAGQVMVAHWQWLGYDSPAAMMNEARSGIDGQLRQMFLYIDKAGLVPAMKRLDWHAFARGYNGPAYAKHGYQTKLAKAYERYAKRPSPAPETGVLKLGSKGAGVRELQTLLTRAGFPVRVDGDFGNATHDAVRAFQMANDLNVDGRAGPQTMRALERYIQGPDDRPGELSPTEVPEARDAAKGLGVLGFITAARDQIAEGATYLMGIEAETAQTVANAMLAGAALIGAGLALWGLLGWLRSRRTQE